jgi:hypothetical protein
MPIGIVEESELGTMNGAKIIVSLLVRVALCALLASCMPEAQQPRSGFATDGQTPTTNGGSSGGQIPTEQLFNFNGETRNFIDFNGARNFGVQDISIDNQNPLTIWGNSVQTQINNLPGETRVCIMTEFRNTSPSKILITSAVRRRVILSTTQTPQGPVSTVGYSWLVYPNDDLRNQSDCLTSGIVSAKNTVFGLSNEMKFSLQSICSDCTTTIQSEGMRVFFDSGNSFGAINLEALKLRILLNAGGTGNAPFCSSNSFCGQIGFNCCLDGQCVKDGAVRPGVDTSSAAYLTALEDVQNNPIRFKIYPQFFYVCPTNVSPDPVGGDATDPVFEALKRLNELKDLHQCLNSQNDEIAYCSIRFPNASERITSTDPSQKIFTVKNDDNNFRWANSSLPLNTIHEIRYGEQIIFSENDPSKNQLNVTGSHAIDPLTISNLVSAETVTVTKTLPSNAKDDTLIIRYKIDGTCEKISTTLARCRKTYIQSQVSNPAKPSDHTGSIFRLPDYFDYNPLNPTVPPPTVRVGDTVVPENSTWTIQGKTVVFNPSPTANQKIDITYFVGGTTQLVNQLTESINSAQTRVNEICNCGVPGTSNCNLAPVISNNQVSDFNCVYPQPNIPEPPLQQVVYVSGKNIPNRYFDENGVSWDDTTFNSAPKQEGREFLYTSNNVNQPNNVTNYVGFNEIYGSFAKQATSARPPRRVTVKKDRTYDIFVDSGGFSSCDNCGNDPYTPLQRLFPQNFASRAGGYVPDLFNSKRIGSTGLYRADDLLFGRACFVPATMIPWSHAEDSNIHNQRRKRLATQHFMFANGYQRDWYGFDYGSLIGSFDGVKWFSIGNQRRIKASSSKLFIAVNAYFGDRTIDNTFKVVVNEAVSAANSGSFINHDSMSDGAECQKSHFCSNDDDCISQLGYDYTCKVVTTMTTPWPNFDAAGNEILGSEVRNLSAILGGANGQQRRCVYRGKGATCSLDLASMTPTVNGTNEPGYNACSNNNYCARVDNSNRFNTSIARFASSPVSQNLLITGSPTRDTVGQGARLIGRPLNFYGSDAVTKVQATEWGLPNIDSFRNHLLNELSIPGLCVPGRDIANSDTYLQAQIRVPNATDREAADRVFGVGPAGKIANLGLTSPKILSMCPATHNGNYIHHLIGENLATSAYLDAAIRQNTTSTILNMSEYAALSLFNTVPGTTGVTGTSAITKIGVQHNACMRNPGARCFSDMECAPNDFIATKMKTISNWGSFTNNPAEKAHWTEELICGNPEPAELFGNILNPSFDVKENHCCRETGKTMKVFTQPDQSTNFLNCTGSDVAIAGVNIPLNSANRNPRNNVIYDVASCLASPPPGKFPALVSPNGTTLMPLSRLARQYETLDKMNSRMCCSGNWVRSFAPENGGGHRWGQNRSQRFNRFIFGAWNWYGDGKFTGVGGPLQSTENQEKLACSAENWGSLACEIRNLSEEQSKAYLNWIATFELVGIPQALIPTPTDQTKRLTNEVGDPFTRQTEFNDVGPRIPLTDTLVYNTFTNQVDPDVSAPLPSQGYVSANNEDKLHIAPGKLKKVFSDNEFNCCTPAGGSVPKNANANSCCTGTISDDGGQGEARCCLDDFSDVTVYLNRYVSSEGRGLPDSAYDITTGYIKDPGQVYAIAQAKNLCCSGNIVAGFAVRNLFIPLQGGTILPQAMTRRFVYRLDAIDNNDEGTGPIGTLFDAGLKWNTHFYCAPADAELPPAE